MFQTESSWTSPSPFSKKGKKKVFVIENMKQKEELLQDDKRLTLVVTSKWRHNSSSCCLKICVNLVIVERIPTMLLSSCWQKWSLNPLSNSTKQKKESGSAWTCKEATIRKRGREWQKHYNEPRNMVIGSELCSHKHTNREGMFFTF